MKINKHQNKKTNLLSSIFACIALAFLLSACWSKNISTPYYTQDTAYYCGAASAQMTLDSEKINIYENQMTLYNYIHPHNLCDGWATDPEGLKDVLNRYYPSGHFYIDAANSANDGIKHIAYTIDRYGVPPVSLIYGCGHWVVVRGVYSDKQPRHASGSFSVYGFWVNDPWYGASSLGENKYIDINSWKSDYFTGCDWCARSGKRYISVLDPSPAPSSIKMLLPKAAPRRNSILSVDEVVVNVEDYLEIFMNDDKFSNQFENAPEVIGESTINTPVLVRRSDKRRDAYYIVPLSTNGMTNCAVLIDAYSGGLKEFSFVKKPISYLPKFDVKAAREIFIDNVLTLNIKPESGFDYFHEEEILPALNFDFNVKETIVSQLEFQGRGMSAQKKGGRALVLINDSNLIYQRVDVTRKDIMINNMELIWEPSLENQNQYYPIWEVSGRINSSKQSILGYMDLDGTVYEKKEINMLKGI